MSYHGAGEEKIEVPREEKTGRDHHGAIERSRRETEALREEKKTEISRRRYAPSQSGSGRRRRKIEVLEEEKKIGTTKRKICTSGQREDRHHRGAIEEKISTYRGAVEKKIETYRGAVEKKIETYRGAVEKKISIIAERSRRRYAPPDREKISIIAER